jgi:hypothetical protein
LEDPRGTISTKGSHCLFIAAPNNVITNLCIIVFHIFQKMERGLWQCGFLPSFEHDDKICDISHHWHTRQMYQQNELDFTQRLSLLSPILLSCQPWQPFPENLCLLHPP